MAEPTIILTLTNGVVIEVPNDERRLAYEHGSGDWTVDLTDDDAIFVQRELIESVETGP